MALRDAFLLLEDDGEREIHKMYFQHAQSLLGGIGHPATQQSHS